MQHLQDEINSMSIRDASGQPQQHYCSYCKAETPNSWSAWTDGSSEAGYCDYCWRLWKWFVPESIMELAKQHPWPQTIAYDDCVEHDIEDGFIKQYSHTLVEVTPHSSARVAQRLSKVKPPCLVAMTEPNGWLGPRGQHGHISYSTTYLAVVDQNQIPVLSSRTIHTSGIVVFEVDDEEVHNFTVSVVCTGALLFYERFADPLGNDVSEGMYQIALDNKVRTALGICAKHGHERLVFSSFGCFANNPPHRVAASLRRALSVGGKFHGCFTHVVFAIEHEPCTYGQEIFDTFRTVFEDMTS